MTDTLVLQATVTYGDVDRQELMLLSRLFKRLQDAAIAHANQFGTGTNAVATRSESWVLNRIKVQLERYPRVGEELEITTWSTGIKGFKGFRDFRIRDAGRQIIVRASSLWLYVSLKTKSIMRVPREVVDRFPVGNEPAAFSDLESVDHKAPETAAVYPVTLRYSDFDVNEHVNNAAYLELAQTAVVHAGASAHPSSIALRYAKAIPVGADAVEVRCECHAAGVRFSIERAGELYAVGEAGV